MAGEEEKFIFYDQNGPEVFFLGTEADVAWFWQEGFAPQKAHARYQGDWKVGDEIEVLYKGGQTEMWPVRDGSRSND